MTHLSIHGPELGLGAACEAVLRELPDWFGIEEAIFFYAKEIDGLPTWTAYAGGELAGFLTIKQHNPYAAEILVMGIRPAYHHCGGGRALLSAAEDALKLQGVAFLQVKTLSPTHPDPNYARTRAFYLAVGFRPLEEFPLLWDEHNPCLQMVKHLG